MITAEWVRDAMRKKELSQAQLARMSKVSQPVISNWLNGVREPSDISKTRIAFALDLLEPGDADDKQVSAALSPDPGPEEIPALEPLETDDAPAAPDYDNANYLSAEIVTPSGARVAYWTDDPARAKLYKTGSGARRAARPRGRVYRAFWGLVGMALEMRREARR